MSTEILATERKETHEQEVRLFESRPAIFEEHSRLWMTGFLLATDLTGLGTAVLAALQVRGSLPLLLEPAYLGLYGLLAVTLVLLLARKNLYPGVGLNYVDELRLTTSSISFAFTVMLGITFLLKTTAHYSRLVLVISWLLSLVILPAGRYFMRRLMIRLGLWGEPVVIIGGSHRVRSLVEHFTVNLQLGLRPVAVLESDHCTGCVLDAHTPDSVCSIKAQARRLSLQTALVLIDDLNEIDRLVERYRTLFQRVILIKDKNGRYALNSLEALDFSSFLGLQVRNNLLNPWSQWLKRLADVLISFLGLACLAPILGLITLWIRLDSPGGVFYRQIRLARGGQAFSLLKFRTMHRDGERILADELERSPALRLEWNSYQKLKDDPRITRAGRFLRRFSLDELPQLWNIARGEMSLVGPRPMMPCQRELYGEAFGNYVQVSPGITGLWQVSGRNHTTFARRAELDNEYIQRWSMWLDIFILIKTFKVVFWQKGAY